MYKKLVLAIPHATREITTQWQDPIVEQDANKWTDWHTDKIFSIIHPQIQIVKGCISRFDCDLERLQNDPLEQIGQGILYTKSHSGSTRILDTDTAQSLRTHWHQYQDKLSNAIEDNTLLIDCHSFPEEIANIDICIGYNEDESKPNLKTIAIILKHFANHGYTIDINKPYSNSITPKADKPYHSIMIELNKRIYFNEKELTEKPYAYKIHHCLRSLYRTLLG